MRLLGRRSSILRDDFRRQFGVAGEVIPMVRKVGIAGDDARDFMRDHIQTFLLRRGQVRVGRLGYGAAVAGTYARH